MILGLLKGAKECKAAESKLSTYEIAKRLKISWSTANVHCYKLKSEKKIEGKEVKKDIGEGKKMLWWC